MHEGSPVLMRHQSSRICSQATHSSCSINDKAYDKEWILSAQSLSSMTSLLIMYSKFVWPNLIWPERLNLATQCLMTGHYHKPCNDNLLFNHVKEYPSLCRLVSYTDDTQINLFDIIFFSEATSTIASLSWHVADSIVMVLLKDNITLIRFLSSM